MGAGPGSGPGRPPRARPGARRCGQESTRLPGGDSLIGQRGPGGGDAGHHRLLLAPSTPLLAASQAPPSCRCKCHQVGGDPSPRTFAVTLISRRLRAGPGAEVNFTPDFLLRRRFLRVQVTWTRLRCSPSATCRLGRTRGGGCLGPMVGTCQTPPAVGWRRGEGAGQGAGLGTPRTEEVGALLRAGPPLHVTGLCGLVWRFREVQ